MLEHLDDPAPPTPTATTLAAVLSRSGEKRRRRTRMVLATVAVIALILGVTVSRLVPTEHPARSFGVFDSQTGLLASGTPVPPADLADVIFIGDSRGYALVLHGQQTLLAASTDGGNSWRVIDPDVPASFPAQIEFTDTTHGYLWGGAPSSSGSLPLWITSDGGSSWIEAPLGPVISDVSAIGADVWAVVGTCPLLPGTVSLTCPVDVEVSVDFGSHWAVTPTTPPIEEEPARSVADQELELARITQERAYVLTFAAPGASSAASSGHVVYTADGGHSWVTRPDPCPSQFGFGEELAASGTTDLWMLCASQASAGSQAKALYRSSNGGQTWRLASAANVPSLTGDETLPAQGGLPVVGYVSPYSLGHENLAVLSPTTVWIFPDRSLVFSATQGGQGWVPVEQLAQEGFVEGGSGNIVFADATHGWVSETGTGLWGTTDGVVWHRLGN